jgi:glycosyltransferase involved in cell wall biosynthesis
VSRNPIRPRILCVAHGTIESNSGGVEVYQRLIAEQLRDQFEFLFFAPDLNGGDRGSYVLYSLESDLRESYTPDPPVLPEHASHPGLERIFSDILERHQAALVHFHHLLRQVPSLPAVARGCGVPVVLSVHDFFAVCDEYNLLTEEGRYCGVLEQAPVDCDSCLYELRGYKKGSQGKRRAFYEEALRNSDRVVFNTIGIRDQFQTVFRNLDSSRTRVIGAPSGTRFQAPVARSLEGPLRVLIPNGLSRLKGGDVLCDLVASTRGLPIEYHFFGRTDRDYPDYRVLGLNSMIRLHGAYTRSDLEAFAPSAHLSIHASIWPETYCISLSEMWDLGLVPIASRMGALGERITAGVNGFLVPPGDAGAMKAILVRMLEDRASLERIRLNLSPDLSTSAESCAESIRDLYVDLLNMDGNTPKPVSRPDPITASPTTWSTGRGPKSRRIRKWLQRFDIQG